MHEGFLHVVDKLNNDQSHLCLESMKQASLRRHSALWGRWPISNQDSWFRRRPRQVLHMTALWLLRGKKLSGKTALKLVLNMLLCCVGFSRVMGISLSYVCLLCVFYHGTDFELLLNFLSNTYNLAKSGLKQPALKVRNTIVGVFKLVSVYTCWESLSATFYVGLGGFLFFFFGGYNAPSLC